jgi:hypothetical protein
VRAVRKTPVGWALAAALGLLVLLEYLLIPHEHPVFPWHRVPGYSAIIGLAGAAALVLLTKALGSLFLQRPERDD